MYKAIRAAIVAVLVVSAAWLVAFVRPRDEERVPPGRVVVLPVLILFFLTQKTFIRGIATTGLK